MAEAEESKTSAVEILFYPVLFGMLAISCPACGSECTEVSVGMTTLENEAGYVEGELPPLTQMGVVVYPCGHIFCSSCLTDKVAVILNAREENSLRLSMFHNLIACEEHGIEYPDQS